MVMQKRDIGAKKQRGAVKAEDTGGNLCKTGLAEKVDGGCKRKEQGIQKPEVKNNGQLCSIAAWGGGGLGARKKRLKRKPKSFGGGEKGLNNKHAGLGRKRGQHYS